MVLFLGDVHANRGAPQLQPANQHACYMDKPQTNANGYQVSFPNMGWSAW